MRNGCKVWEGPSPIDGAPIAAFAVGLKKDSRNGKTGPMVQLFIMRTDVNPLEALTTGDDRSVCGDCPRRPLLAHVREAMGLKLPCYASKGLPGLAALAVWKAYHADPVTPLQTVRRYTDGKQWRNGAYGDPALVPIEVLRALGADGDGHTGYTGQWREPRAQAYRGIFMASVYSVAEAVEAWAMGWRTFRSGGPAAPIKGKEFGCPAPGSSGGGSG